MTHRLYATLLAASLGLASPPPPAAAAAPTAGVSILYAFDPVREGGSPRSMVAAPDGRLFGELDRGPDGAGGGAIFELDPPAAAGSLWTERTLFVLPDNDHFNPIGNGRLLLGGNGHLFFAAENTALKAEPSIIFEMTPPAPGGATWSVHVRANDPHVGGVPLRYISLHYVDSSNALYGAGLAVTASGVSDARGQLLRLAPLSSNPAVLFASILAPLCAPNETRGGGCDSISALLPAPDGSFYGSNLLSLFHLTPPNVRGGAWTRQTLPGVATDATLGAIDRSLNLYAYALDVLVDKVTTTKTTILLDLYNHRSIGLLLSGLVQDRTGLLFATTRRGGNNGCCGAVFRLLPTPSVTAGKPPSVHPTLLYTFSGPDGQNPLGLATQRRPDGSRVFVGWTYAGGTGWTGQRNSGAGTVFQIVP